MSMNVSESVYQYKDMKKLDVFSLGIWHDANTECMYRIDLLKQSLKCLLRIRVQSSICSSVPLAYILYQIVEVIMDYEKE